MKEPSLSRKSSAGTIRHSNSSVWNLTKSPSLRSLRHQQHQQRLEPYSPYSRANRSLSRSSSSTSINVSLDENGDSLGSKIPRSFSDMLALPGSPGLLSPCDSFTTGRSLVSSRSVIGLSRLLEDRSEDSSFASPIFSRRSHPLRQRSFHPTSGMPLVSSRTDYSSVRILPESSFTQESTPEPSGDLLQPAPILQSSPLPPLLSPPRPHAANKRRRGGDDSLLDSSIISHSGTPSSISHSGPISYSSPKQARLKRPKFEVTERAIKTIEDISKDQAKNKGFFTASFDILDAETETNDKEQQQIPEEPSQSTKPPSRRISTGPNLSLRPTGTLVVPAAEPKTSLFSARRLFSHTPSFLTRYTDLRKVGNRLFASASSPSLSATLNGTHIPKPKNEDVQVTRKRQELLAFRKMEADRKRREQEEHEQQERERIRREREERERREREELQRRQEAERARLEAERKRREEEERRAREEQERIAKEKAAREREAAEKAAKEKTEQLRREQEQREAQEKLNSSAPSPALEKPSSTGFNFSFGKKPAEFGSETKAPSTEEQSGKTPLLSFGSAPSTAVPSSAGTPVAAADGTGPAKPLFSFGTSTPSAGTTETPKPSFTFGAPSRTASPALTSAGSDAAAKKPMFSFGQTSANNSSAPQAAEPAGNNTPKLNFSFGGSSNPATVTNSPVTGAFTFGGNGNNNNNSASASAAFGGFSTGAAGNANNNGPAPSSNNGGFKFSGTPTSFNFNAMNGSGTPSFSFGGNTSAPVFSAPSAFGNNGNQPSFNGGAPAQGFAFSGQSPANGNGPQGSMFSFTPSGSTQGAPPSRKVLPIRRRLGRPGP